MQEIKWAIAIAVLTTAVDILKDFDPERVTSNWVMIAVAALGRAAITGALVGMAKLRSISGDKGA